MLALLVAAALTACSAPAPAPVASPSASPAAPSPSPSATSGPSAGPSAGPTSAPAGPLALPACADLLPLSFVQSIYTPQAEALDVGVAPAEVMPGPAAAAAVTAAVSSEICSWGIPASEAGFHVVVAELSATSRDALVTALRAAGTFTEHAAGARTTFTRDLSSEDFRIAVTYAFDGSAWVTATGTATTEVTDAVAATAMDAVIAANPR